MIIETYETKISPEILQELALDNIHADPKISKVVVNMGVGKHKDNEAYLEDAKAELALITGQQPIERKSRLAVAGFKLRQGEVVGLQVTLRGNRMWSFIERLVNVALPRVKDFQGIKVTAFDEAGNYSLGLREHVVFPEIDPTKVRQNKPLEITLVMQNIRQPEDSKKLLDKLGFPFKK